MGVFLLFCFLKACISLKIASSLILDCITDNCKRENLAHFLNHAIMNVRNVVISNSITTRTPNLCRVGWAFFLLVATASTWVS